jgi:hypothetical protein
VSLIAVSWQRLLILEIIQFQALTSLHSGEYPATHHWLPAITLESESESVTLRLAVYRQSVRLGVNPLRLTTSIFVFQLNTCGYSPYVTSSLTRERVCRLQLLLVLASEVILRSESRGTDDHILLPEIRDSPNLEGQVPVFISPRDSVAQLYPQALSSLFVASCHSQGYGGGIRPRLHMGDWHTLSSLSHCNSTAPAYKIPARTTEKTLFTLL